MKKLNIIIALAITFILAAGSIGIVFAAQATSSTASTTQGAIDFTAPSGIRWNEGMQVFEVFNYTGVSIMGQGVQYVNAVGDVNITGGIGFKLATAQENYNIMKDIPFDDNATVYNDFKDSGSINFGASPATTGIIDGRGFTFKNFPVRGSMGLYYNFNGTLRNLNLDYGIVTSEYFRGIFNTNYGKIENCTVSGNNEETSNQFNVYYPFGYINQETGEIKNCTNYFSAVFTGVMSLTTGFVGNNNGLISNCTNQANIQAARSTGIVLAARKDTTAKILDCTNNGNITAIDSADTTASYNIAAGIAYAGSSTAYNYTIRGCVNNGTVTALNSTYGVASGILAAPHDASITSFFTPTVLTNSYNNTNNGTVTSARANAAFPLYHGRQDGINRD